MRLNSVKSVLMLLFALVLCAPAGAAKKKVHTIGDSTMANYATDGSTDKRGWAQMLQQFFNIDNVEVNNRGKSGASSKSFYHEAAYWPTMVKGGSDAMQAGDYLLIQFAHNDEKTGGADGDTVKAYYNYIGNAASAGSTDYRGTTASGTFKKYIRAYINEAKAMGVTPIVVGPICRKYYINNGTAIRRNGYHDLGDSFTKCDGRTYSEGNKVPESDDSQDYVAQARKVANEYDDVPFIDLTSLTAALYLKYGEAYVTASLFCSGDNTHPAALGATLIAREFAQQLKNQAATETDAKKKAVLEGLAQDVVVSSEITFNPVSGDMGKAYQGQSIVKEYNVSAFGIASGSKMTITTTAPFLISTDKENYSNSIELAADGTNIIETIYVKVSLNAAGTQTGTLTATSGSMTTTVDLTAQAISLTGGTEASVTWPLTANGTPAASELLTAADQSFTGLKVKQYGNIGTDPAVRKMQMLYPEAEKWGIGEIDEVSTRYAEFKVTCPADYKFAADKISYYVAGKGGSAVSYHAYYSTSRDFSNPVLMDEKIRMTNNVPTLVEYSLATEIEEGQSIYVRLYPWYDNQSSEATGKYLCVSDMTIHGMASKAGGAEVNYTGSVAYSLVDSDPVFNPEAMTVGFVGKTVDYGNLLTVSANGGNKWSGSTDNGKVQTKVYNGSGATLPKSAVDGNTITFTLTPEDGVVFLPSRVSFQGARYGTDGGTITASISGMGSAEICDNAAINRSGKSLELTTLSADISGVSANAENPLVLKISVLGLGNTKNVGLNDIVIEGTMQGTIYQTVKYSLNTNVTPVGAGSISLDPEMAAYKENSEVTATAERNFGYKFKEWQVDGTTVSMDEAYTFTMDKDKSLTAVFTEIPVYTVSTSCTNDAELSLGSVVLSPNDHNGKYEGGTEITATALENDILKFMQWTDGNANAGTSATRTLTVNGDMKLVANYEVQDFIAVFDASATQTYAYSTTANYPFPADITWDEARNATASVVRLSDGTPLYSQSTGTPVVRNRVGVVMSGINGLYQNGYDTRDIAWQYQFSTKGFTAASFNGNMAAKNMAAKNYKAQYSLDGTTFTDIEGAAWTMTANVMADVAFDLPAEAVGKDIVYVRVLGYGDELLSSSYSFDSEFDGMKYTAHSESGIGNLYILGKAEVVADDIAPKVTATIPVKDAKGASASGSVTISFDERIQAGTAAGVATLNGKEIAPKWNTRSVSFDYVALEYGQTYTFKMPAGYVADLSGNSAEAVEFSFTVMERQKPAARIFDAVVDRTLDLPQGGFIEATADMPKQYRYIQDAIDDAPAASTKPYLIYIKEGYYNDSNTSFASGYGFRYTTSATGSGAPTERIEGGKNAYDDCRLIHVNKPNIHLIGQAVDKVTIATDRLAGGSSDPSRVWYHVSAAATLEVQEGATDFYMQGVTLDNENWTIKGMEGPQALAMNISADRVTFDGINARSYQDTYKGNGTFSRHFFYNSTIEGGVDFIYGDGDVWFENCTLNINRKGGGWIVAPSHPDNTRWGYVFNNTLITTTYASNPEDYQIYLGRPWHNAPKTVFLHTKMEVKPYDGYWYPTMGGLPALWAVYDIVDKNGYALSEKSIEDYYYMDGDTKVEGKAKNFLTAEEVAEYTIPNVMKGDGTSATTGVWNPMEVVEKTATPVLAQKDGVVTWTGDDYAICYVVTVNGKPVTFTTETTFTANAGDKVQVQSVNEHGALSPMSAAIDVTTGIDEVSADADGNADAAIYNLAGQRVLNAKNGIFVVNGKKVARK